MTDVNQFLKQAVEIIRSIGTSSAPVVHSQKLGQNLLAALRVIVQLIIIALEALIKILKLLLQ